MRLVFNPMTASLDYVDLPAGVKVTRTGGSISLFIDTQEVAQWNKEVVPLKDMAGDNLQFMDGNDIDFMG